MFKPDAIVIHYTESDDVTASIVDAWHKARGFTPRGSNPLKYIGYHALVRKNGVIELGRSLDVQGTHCLGHNTHTLAICMCGSNQMLWYPSTVQYRAVAAWCENRMDEHRIPKSRIFFHKDLNSTSCPGRADKARILSLIDEPTPNGGDTEEVEEMLRLSDNVANEHHFVDVWTSEFNMQYLHIQLRSDKPARINIYATRDVMQKPFSDGKFFKLVHTFGLTPSESNPNPYFKMPLDAILAREGFVDCSVSVHSNEPIVCALREGNYE